MVNFDNQQHSEDNKEVNSSTLDFWRQNKEDGDNDRRNPIHLRHQENQSYRGNIQKMGTAKNNDNFQQLQCRGFKNQNHSPTSGFWRQGGNYQNGVRRDQEDKYQSYGYNRQSPKNGREHHNNENIYGSGSQNWRVDSEKKETERSEEQKSLNSTHDDYTTGPYNPYKDPNMPCYRCEDSSQNDEKKQPIRKPEIQKGECPCGNRNCKLHLNRRHKNRDQLQSSQMSGHSFEKERQNQGRDRIDNDYSSQEYLEENNQMQKWNHHQNQAQGRIEFDGRRHSTGNYQATVPFWGQKENQRLTEYSEHGQNMWNRRPEEGQRQERHGFQLPPPSMNNRRSCGGTFYNKNWNNNQFNRMNGQEQGNAPQNQRFFGRPLHSHDNVGINHLGNQKITGIDQWKREFEGDQRPNQSTDKVEYWNLGDA